MSPMEPKNWPKRAEDGPKRGQEHPKTTLRGSKKRTQTARRKKNQTKTVLAPTQGRLAQLSRPPRAPFGRPNRHQNRSQNDQKSKRNIKRQKNRSKTTLDPSWSDLRSFWSAILGEKTPEAVYLKGFVKNHFFEDKTVRRRFRDQLRPKKAPA